MPFGPSLFSGQLTTQNSSQLMSPPQLDTGVDMSSLRGDPVSEDLSNLASNSEPTKGIQLNEYTLSPQASFMTRSGEFVMPNKNPESFLRQGGLIVDGDSIYLDSLEQSQVPSANLRGMLIRMVQGGARTVNVRSLTKDRVVDSKELIRKRFRLL
jgi:hypothetical protein